MVFAGLNTEVFKYVLVGITFPFWMPFFRALYAELNDALAEEGGLFGRTPTAREIQIIARDPNRSRSPLVSHEFDPDGHSPRGGRESAPKNAAPQRARGPAAKPPGIGFSKPRGVRGFARKDQRGS
jgi:hypothetical protein